MSEPIKTTEEIALERTVLELTIREQSARITVALAYLHAGQPDLAGTVLEGPQKEGAHRE